LPLVVQHLRAHLQEQVRSPSGIHCICCFFTMRLLTTWFTADSTKPVLIRSPDFDN
jgi:hypothetical protein